MCLNREIVNNHLNKVRIQMKADDAKKIISLAIDGKWKHIHFTAVFLTR